MLFKGTDQPMRRFCLLLLLPLLVTCAALRAQTFDLQTARQPIASLDGLWHFRTGDNPMWANPGFDDSQWPLLRSNEDWGRQGYKDYSGVAWYRFQVTVPAGEDSFSLLLPRIVTSYQVYANGLFLGGCGGMPPRPVGRFCHAKIFTLPSTPSAGPQTLTIALRVWQWPAWASYYGGGPYATSYLGATPLLRTQLRLQLDAYIRSVMQYYFLILLAAMGALVSFALFLFRRNDWEYLWFGCMLLMEAAGHTVEIYRHLHPVGIVTFFRYDSMIDNLGLFAAVAFYYVLLRGRRSWLFYAALVGVVLTTLGNLLYSLPNARNYVRVATMNIFSTIVILPIILWIVVLLLRRAREKLVDARLLLAPVLLVYAEQIANSFFIITYQLGWQHRSPDVSFPLLSELFPLNFHVLAEFLFLIAMLAILVNRFARTRSQEERYANEFEAARSVQSLLISPTPPSTPGFHVESVYLPAQEVGGDFFQILPGKDGSLLIVVGDVSGKGLRAAMTVSTIVGALRGCSLRRPAEVLAHLNRVLYGQIDGFVTCSAALIAADGAMMLANAGHLAPYRNGQELAVESGLPLGILAEITYAETRYQLAVGDRLTFVSDGVVEATNEKRELFSFERTQAISNQSPQAIAETAKNFGQEDDISVLLVKRIDANIATVLKVF
jgi:hypothetical protein